MTTCTVLRRLTELSPQEAFQLLALCHTSITFSYEIALLVRKFQSAWCVSHGPVRKIDPATAIVETITFPYNYSII